jgi:hypothetical protein
MCSFCVQEIFEVHLFFVIWQNNFCMGFIWEHGMLVARDNITCLVNNQKSKQVIGRTESILQL